MKQYKKIDWDNYRFTDGTLGLMNILSDRYEEPLEEEVLEYATCVTKIHPIRSRQVAAQIIALCDIVQDEPGV